MIEDHRSDGVVLAGESKEVFWEEPDTVKDRRDEDFLTTRQYRGTVYNVPVDGGSRTYYLERNIDTDPWQNKAMAMLGVFMLVLGLAGLGLERKLAQP